MTIFNALRPLILLMSLCDVLMSAGVADEIPGGELRIRPPRRPPNQNTIWGLNENDSFTVSVNIDKTTKVRIGDDPETVSRTNDQLTLNYFVVQVQPDKDCLMIVEIGLGDRNVDAKSPDAIQIAAKAPPATERQTLAMMVAPDGTVRARSPNDVQELMRGLAIADPQVEKMLSEACPEDVITGWLARPFWISPGINEKSTDQKEQSWVRPLTIAAGNFGSVLVDAEIKLETTDEEYSTVTIGGKGRFRPLVVPEKMAESRNMLLKSMTLELDEFSGKARMWRPPQEKTPAVDFRPMLEDMSVTCRLHGSGTLPARGKMAEQTVTFEQIQVQSWLVTAHSIGILDYRLSPSVPVEAR